MRRSFRAAARAIAIGPSWSRYGGSEPSRIARRWSSPRDRPIRLGDGCGDPNRWRTGAWIAWPTGRTLSRVENSQVFDVGPVFDPETAGQPNEGLLLVGYTGSSDKHEPTDMAGFGAVRGRPYPVHQPVRASAPYSAASASRKKPSAENVLSGSGLGMTSTAAFNVSNQRLPYPA